MLAVSLVFGSFLIILFFIVGIISGWIVRENYRQFPKMHPEFFDDEGNIISDEVVSLKIEPGFYDEFMEEYNETLDDDDDDENK